MKVFLGRLLAYARGDSDKGGAVGDELLQRDGRIPWLTEHSQELLVEYSLDAALRSARHAEDAVGKVQDKAASLIGITLATLAGALALSNAALHIHHDPPCLQWISFAAWCVVDVALVLAALNAFLATAPSDSIGLNLAILKAGTSTSPVELKQEEAGTWHRSALLAMQTATRRGNDVFACRRCLLAALLAALAAAVLTIVRITQ